MPVLVACLAVLLGVLAAPPAPAAAARGAAWVAPLRPLDVRRFFEPPPEPWLAGHRGVDLGGRPGQVVVAAGAGLVSFAGPLAGRGVVAVVHGALRTTYEPVRPLVAEGDAVGAGEAIGLLEPGHARGPGARLHWGLLRGRTYLDPLRLLGHRPSRLLPLGEHRAGVPVAGRAVTAADGPGPGSASGGGAARAGPVAAAVTATALAGAGVARSARRRWRPP